MHIRGVVYSDGGARGNPGPAGIGVVLTWEDDGGRHERNHKEYIGETTNNVAEYRALLQALTMAHELHVEELVCYLDSELVVKQLNREYRVKDKELQQLFLQVWNSTQTFTQCRFMHIPREQNARADALVNQAIDEAMKTNQR